MGHLIDILVSHLANEILSVNDITEAESVRIGEILGIVKELENTLMIQPGEVRSFP